MLHFILVLEFMLKVFTFHAPLRNKVTENSTTLTLTLTLKESASSLYVHSIEMLCNGRELKSRRDVSTRSEGYLNVKCERPI